MSVTKQEKTINIIFLKGTSSASFTASCLLHFTQNLICSRLLFFETLHSCPVLCHPQGRTVRVRKGGQRRWGLGQVLLSGVREQTEQKGWQHRTATCESVSFFLKPVRSRRQIACPILQGRAHAHMPKTYLDRCEQTARAGHVDTCCSSRPHLMDWSKWLGHVRRAFRLGLGKTCLSSGLTARRELNRFWVS